MMGKYLYRVLWLLATSISLYAFDKLVLALNTEGSTTFMCLGSSSLNAADKESSSLSPLFFIFWAVIFSPLIEEYLFRYLIIGRLRKYMPVYIAILISTLLFTALHTQYWINGWEMREVLLITLSGVVYGYVFIARNSIFDSIIVTTTNAIVLMPKQAINNLCGVWSNELVYGALSLIVAVVAFAILAILQRSKPTAIKALID